VRLLGHPGDSEWRQTDEGLFVQLPARKPCDLACALKIAAGDLDPVPVVYDQRIGPGADGRIVLTAADATVHGDTPRYESGGGKDQIGYWANASDYVSRDVQIPRAAKYTVEVTYSCAAPGSAYAVAVGETRLLGKSASTGSWASYRTDSLGAVDVGNPGRLTVCVKPESEPRWRVIGLQRVTLSPVR
jgi:alpha-L-fucosidase